MKARVKILVNGITGTVLTGAIAAGLVMSSSNTFGNSKKELAKACELEISTDDYYDFTAEEISTEAEQTVPVLESKLFSNEYITEKMNSSSAETDETSKDDNEAELSQSMAAALLEDYFSDKGIVDENKSETCLNVRKEASEEAELVNTLGVNKIVSIISQEGDWSCIEADGITGWVRTEYLLTGTAAAEFTAENGSIYARVDVPNMNMRLRPSTDADILAVAYADDIFEIEHSENGWVYAAYSSDISGYLSGDCLKLTYCLNDNRIDTDIELTDENLEKLEVPEKETASGYFTYTTYTLDTSDSSKALEYDFVQASSEETLPAAESEQQTVGSVSYDQEAAQPVTEIPAESTAPVQVPEETQPVTSTQPVPETTARAITSIEAFYRGSSDKKAGDVVCRSEVYVMVYYNDGSSEAVEDGWTSADIGMMLSAGENVISVQYNGMTSNIVLNAAAVQPETAPQTQPETAPQTQPETAPQTQPETVPQTQPETVPQTQPETTAPAQPTGNIRVSNVSLDTNLTSYTLSLCSQYGIDSSVVFSVMYHESRFNVSAVSPHGAVGLMQIIPRYSADRMNRLGVSNISDPASNILVGVDILAEYYHTYGSWTQALTKYRSGSASGDTSYASLILGTVGMFQSVYYE